MTLYIISNKGLLVILDALVNAFYPLQHHYNKGYLFCTLLLAWETASCVLHSSCLHSGEATEQSTAWWKEHAKYGSEQSDD